METLDEAALRSWTFEPLVVLTVVLSAWIYFRGWRVLRRTAPTRFNQVRLFCFLGGLGALVLALCSPLDAFASWYLMAHMVQHLLLTMVAAPLLLLGHPYLPLLRGLPRVIAREVLGPFLTWPLWNAIGRFLTHPVVCWVSFVTATLIWHVPPMYELALASEAWHKVEHACFLGTALLFWWPVVQPWPSRPHWPRWAMIPYLLLGDIANTGLAAFLSFYDRILYPTYAHAPRFGGMSALEDQAGAGAIMWVPGSLTYLIPAGLIAASLLKPKGIRPSEFAKSQLPSISSPSHSPATAPKPQPFDLLKVPVWGRMLRSLAFRRVIQSILLLLAAAIVIDGILGPETSPMNLAGVLPWTHWRAFTVVALLVAGNFFCMACPFTWVRDLGRRILPANRTWPRLLKGKWIAGGLLVIYLASYEVFSLWDQPLVTAGIILGYFVLALVVDGIFRGASFCKYVCPIGQFHFVQSLCSPLEVRVRNPDVCADCRTYECIRGSETQRGCELQLFLPRKAGNMDCTFCLDCVRACPSDNVGLLPAVPGSDLWNDVPRSSVGRFGRRPDLAVLGLVLTFGAFANAAGMVAPVVHLAGEVHRRIPLLDHAVFFTLFIIGMVIVFPAGMVSMAAGISRWLTRIRTHELTWSFTMAWIPLGVAMWSAHFLFHFFTASHTPIPVMQRVASNLGWWAGEPQWSIRSWAFEHLPGLEMFLLDCGFLLSLYAVWRIAGRWAPRQQFRLFLPWAIGSLILFLLGIWIIFQPMEMRGTLGYANSVIWSMV